jgi:hypothetical protein
VEDPAVGGSIMLQLVLMKEDGDGDWYDLAENRSWCRALVNLVTNFRVP